MLPIGVVIPTRESIRYLPEHVNGLSRWIELADQIVVVDSYSADGSMRYLQENLRHPRVLFLSHPPGLYASWNHGIRHVTAEFCHISTVGDSISREGIEHLVSTASALQSDVLVSRPNFVDEAGRPCDGPEWPMDDLVNVLKVTEPCPLPSAAIVATALAHTGGAITGSCGSDLFRTTALQQFPFPTDYGHSGDAAWSLQNAGRLKWAVTRKIVSTFRWHPPTAPNLHIKDSEDTRRYAEMAPQMVGDWLANHPECFPEELLRNVKDLLSLSIAYKQRRHECNRFRKSPWPWILNPAAWAARVHRDALKGRVQGLFESICRESGRSLVSR